MLGLKCPNRPSSSEVTAVHVHYEIMIREFSRAVRDHVTFRTVQYKHFNEIKSHVILQIGPELRTLLPVLYTAVLDSPGTCKPI